MDTDFHRTIAMESGRRVDFQVVRSVRRQGSPTGERGLRAELGTREGCDVALRELADLCPIVE